MEYSMWRASYLWRLSSGRSRFALGSIAGRFALGASLGVSVLGCASNREMRSTQEPALASQATIAAVNEPPVDLVTSARARERQPDQVGTASWYGSAFAGHRTASGERYDPHLFTGAHKQLPFGTWVEVRRIDTGRSVRVRINDRGPNGKAKSRLIDLSRRAAEDIDLVRVGVARVELRIVDGPSRELSVNSPSGAAPSPFNEMDGAVHAD
jgi:rare lipoprotein A